ncbi:sensor histidine kinase [Deinococcus oregonensis]|uniref:histidine kinase n=1 Tax=Deinococcus oregonensis TaxID=1805970 RepID=A0ABV6B201_9DEIO
MNQRSASPSTTSSPTAPGLGSVMTILFVLAYALTLSEPLPAGLPRGLFALLGAAYVLIATLGFPAVQHDRRVGTGLAYLCGQTALGFSLVAIGGIGIGNVLLLLLMISQISQVLPLGWALATCALLPFAHVGMRWADAMREGAGLFVAGVFVVLITRVAINERQLRAEKEGLAEELRRANTQLLAAAAQTEELSTARERNRLAREIHDGLGHHLTAVHVHLQAAQAVMHARPDIAERAVEKARALTGEALADVRRSVAALRALPTPLPEALSALAEEMIAAGVPTTIQVLNPPVPLVPAVEQNLYRIAQEALTNVRKHAQATRVIVTLDQHEHELALTVTDDGVGTTSPSGGFGLLGMRERVGALGGNLHVETAPGYGLTVHVTVPT